MIIIMFLLLLLCTVQGSSVIIVHRCNYKCLIIAKLSVSWSVSYAPR